MAKTSWEGLGVKVAIAGVVLSSFFSAYSIWDGNRKYEESREIARMELHQQRAIELTKEYAHVTSELLSFLYKEKAIVRWELEEARAFQSLLYEIWKTHLNGFNEAEKTSGNLYPYYLQIENFKLNFSQIQEGILPILNNIHPLLDENRELRDQFEQFIKDNHPGGTLGEQEREILWNRMVNRKADQNAKTVFAEYIKEIKKQNLFE